MDREWTGAGSTGASARRPDLPGVREALGVALDPARGGLLDDE